MKKLLSICFSLFFLSFCLPAQELDQQYLAKFDSLQGLLLAVCGGQDDDRVRQLVIQYDSIAATQNDWEGRFSALDWMLYCASEGERLNLLRESLQQMDSLLLTNGGEIEPSMKVAREINLNFLYGSFRYRFGDFDAAQMRFLKTIELIKADASGDFIDYEVRAYRYLGGIYRQAGNYQAAIELYQQARGNNFAQGNRSDWGLYSKYLADIYTQRKDYHTAASYYREAYHANHVLFQDDPSNLRIRNRLVSTLHAFGELFLLQSEPDSGLYYLNQAQKLQPAEDPALAQTYQLLGTSYQQKKDYEAAKRYFQLALAATELQYGRQSLIVGENLRRLGDLFAEQKDYTLALTFFQQSLESLVPGFEQDRIGQNPSLQGLYVRKELLYTLGSKAKALRNMHLEEPDHVLALTEIAYETVQLAIGLIDSLKTDYSDDADKQLLVDESYPIIELGLDLAFTLYQETQEPAYLAAAYQMMEKSRAVALFESLKTAHAQDFAGIPSELQKEERNYRYQLSLLRDSIQQQTDPAENPQRLQKFQSLKLAYQNLVSRFEIEYPAYHQLKYEQAILPLADLQRQLLSPDESLLEYFVGDNNLYLLEVSAEKVHLFKLPNDFGLANMIQDFRAGIFEYFVGEEAFDDADYERLSKQYTDAAYRLYQSLFAPYQNDSLRLATHLVIVPDGMLGYLPFGALLQAPVENATTFRSHDYLLRSHSVSYVPSASLWAEMHNEDPLKGKSTLLAFAPIFSGESADLRSSWIRDTLPLAALPYTERELTDIQTVIQTDIYLNEKANLLNFHQLSSQHRLIHLATHGVLNDEDPNQSFLAFYPSPQSPNQDGRLMLQELYAMDIPAEMVVLSACETGIGRFSRGEGLLSLARGFSYAGTRSLLATLWRIPDGEVNQDLLPHFYRALKDGQTKSEAIRSAQLAQVNEAFADQLAHPFFWAAFTPIGDMRPLQTLSKAWWWGLGIVIFVLVFALWWRKRNISANS